MIQKAHGTSGAHIHTHQNLETEGGTIGWARLYDVLVNFILLGQYRSLVNSMLTLAHIQPEEKVLDVGCGTGTLAIAAKLNSHPSATIHGLDAAPEMIERARQKAAQAGADVDFQPALVETIPFADNTFDLVMNSLMVHHLPGDLKSRAFAEMYRVLKPGGRLLVVDFEPPTNPVIKAALRLLLGRGMLAIDNSVLPPLLEATGFTDVKSGKTGSSLATFISGVKAPK
ncbi:MAG: class I SAM-dependent methyltransferase [Anaerolineae bacterium]|nr:class I SAM-dependent methyltransferase [Anaerolineae bacterium]